MPPKVESEDDPVTMTGPGYRMTSPFNRGTSGSPAGGTGGGRRVAQAAGQRGDSLPKRAIDLLDAASAQRLAEALVAELRGFFADRYGRFAGASSPRLGDKVSIRVLPENDFAREVAVHRDETLVHLRSLITKYIPEEASRRISGFGTGPDVKLIPVSASTRLTAAQMRLILPDIPPDTGELRSAGFYSNARKTIFLDSNHVDAGSVAHEMTHAYSSPLWREFHFALKLQSAAVTSGAGRGKQVWEVFRQLDEGLTSALAQPVIDDWFHAPFRKGMIARPSSPPRASGGYLSDVTTQMEKFVGVVDGTLSTPKTNSFLAYFGGEVVFTIDEAEPLESDVRFGRGKNRKLREIL